MSKSTTTSATPTTRADGVTAAESQDGYPELERLLRRRGAALSGRPLFTTGIACSLFDLFLHYLPRDRQQHYRCNACRRFVETYGGLVILTSEGEAHTAFWHPFEVPDFFRPAVTAMRQAVQGADITGVFLSPQAIWGQPQTGVWTHLCCDNYNPFKHALDSADQAMAKKKQEYQMVRRALAEISVAAAEEAVRVLESDALDRSDKHKGPARWFRDLAVAVKATKDRRRMANLVWLAVASAPEGWAHVRSGMLMTLYDDILAGKAFAEIAGAWKHKMHPLKYQRPTAAPATGTIKQAEEIVAKLGTAGALNRRFARLEDVIAVHSPLWLPSRVQIEEASLGGVFGHLQQPPRLKKVRGVELPQQTIRWTKFAAEVLPTAQKIEVWLAGGNQPLFGLVTAVDPLAPPVLQWDSAERVRNPVSWFFYHESSTPYRWGLRPHAWVEATAVFRSPPYWQMPELFQHQPDMAMFALKGCIDQKPQPGGGLFPECLKSEYHAVRSVIEAHMKTQAIQGVAEATANGFALQKGVEFRLKTRVTAADGRTQEYMIDRWD